MKLTFTGCVAGALLAVVASAQSRYSVELSTADACGVHANRQIDAVRAGTIADRAIQLTATDPRVAAAGSVAKPELFSTPQGAAPGASFDWAAHVEDGNTGGTLGGAPLAAGPQHYELVLTAAQPVQGRLVVGFVGNVRGRAVANAAVATGGAAKRFAADGTAQRDAFDGITVGPRGLHVDVYLNGDAAGVRGQAAGYQATLHVMFVADGGGTTCEVLPGQRSCPAGGVLQGAARATSTGGVLALGLTGALPNAIGVTIVSPDGQTFPIANLGCVFFSNAIVHGTFASDANGDARTQVNFPLRIGSFFVQDGTLLVTPRGVQLGTSNTLEVRCR